MLIGVFPAHKDGNGEWRFVIMTYDDNMTSGRIICGTEPEEDGMLEPKFRAALAEDFKLSSADIERAVELAKRDKPAGNAGLP